MRLLDGEWAGGKWVADMRRFWVLLVSVVSAVSLGLAVPSAASAQESPPLPHSMAAIGDSMTQAADVCCWYGDHPANSWSTGGASWDGVYSHYERIRALNGAISGHAYNDSVSGAKMSAAPAQASKAVAQGAQYVTILMGANDVCTSSPSTMTSVATFRSQYQSALATLDAGLPQRARIFVASIPDIYHLWQIYYTDATAELVWDVANICQSMLSPSRTATERQAVRQRNIDFNTVLQQECAKYTRCKFDGNAVFNYPFSRSQVSKLDYFHPSLSGQAALASVTWSASWWG
ncbi:MAG TPA: SGNH/GDSL hydrolase family protein [Dermatophilaceae bacterium]|jgi:lysophospholipase L1-like esterase|nr:SGNH/GDSL hydrolase family protein [Dermatophilaceae bacterium]